MKCERCGKELKCLGDLTEEELKNYQFVSTKQRTAETALDREVVNFKEMSSEQVYMYFKAIFDLQAEASFLDVENRKNIAKRLNVEDLRSLLLVDGRVYIHPQE